MSARPALASRDTLRAPTARTLWPPRLATQGFESCHGPPPLTRRTRTTRAPRPGQENSQDFRRPARAPTAAFSRCLARQRARQAQPAAPPAHLHSCQRTTASSAGNEIDNCRPSTRSAAEMWKNSHHPLRRWVDGTAPRHNRTASPLPSDRCTFNDQCYPSIADNRGPFLWSTRRCGYCMTATRRTARTTSSCRIPRCVPLPAVPLEHPHPVTLYTASALPDRGPDPAATPVQPRFPTACRRARQHHPSALPGALRQEE